MKWAFKHAERLGASHLVIIGEDEIAKGIVQVKNLAKGEQVEVEVSKVSDFIAEQLASSE